MKDDLINFLDLNRIEYYNYNTYGDTILER